MSTPTLLSLSLGLDAKDLPEIIASHPLLPTRSPDFLRLLF